MVKCTCLNCGITFEEFQSKVDAGKGKFHSKECQYNYGRETRTCLCGCGKTFTVKKSSPKQYFDKSHFYKMGWDTFMCKQCGLEFRRKKSRQRKDSDPFHNRECARLYFNANPEERAKKISISNKGRIKGPEWRDKLALASTGQVHTEEHNRKIKESTIKTYQEHPEIILKTVKYGPDNGMFNGYSSFGDYSKEFNDQRKEECRSKYNHKCVVCGTTKFGKGRKLDIHHIDYNKLNSELNNLYPLCIKCHNLTKVPNDGIKNSWYGWFTMMKWEEELGLR